MAYGRAAMAEPARNFRARPELPIHLVRCTVSPRHGRRRSAIRAFAAVSTARRGWPAFADHDGGVRCLKRMKL